MDWNREKLEKYSSAVTLSDMEIFVFPELLYSLVLANIMSPIVWRWRDDRWFRNIQKKTPYRRVLRLKQYILDHYEFNLDLDTWGLTTQEAELKRFEGLIDAETLSASNALFGYEGDRYYFDMDIRRHFGLDKYTDNTIPYWKTETVEAMEAFCHREGYTHGAGECVSLSGLYAAALFVVCGIPLEDIYLMATPLHSQNFVCVDEGLLTNNRRIVTKNMWFNGSELSARAQRALRNERVTMVSHISGHIHTLYPDATIAPEQFDRFVRALKDYLTTEVDMDILLNFLRYRSDLQTCFQIEHLCHGKPRYLPAEKAFAYEHSSSYRMDTSTWDQLIDEIDVYEFSADPLPDRMLLNFFDSFFKDTRVRFDDRESVDKLMMHLQCPRQRNREISSNLEDFCRVEPRLPNTATKQFESAPALPLHPDMSREEIVDTLASLRDRSTVADLAFYAFRDLARTDWEPYLKAALERNPVSVEGAKDLSDADLTARLEALPNESIYDGARVAQPDEVWNYGRGDGLERAFTLATILKARHPDRTLTLTAGDGSARLTGEGVDVRWPGDKGLERSIEL